MFKDSFYKEKMTENKNPTSIKFATDIISAYVSNHNIDKDDLLELIEEVYLRLVKLQSSENTQGQDFKPVVPVEDSILENAIICLEDGKKFKLLKRHLSRTYNMSPEQYRSKWGLPSDYPMVAPSYSKKRSHLAKASGLGSKKI